MSHRILGEIVEYLHGGCQGAILPIRRLVSEEIAGGDGDVATFLGRGEDDLEESGRGRVRRAVCLSFSTTVGASW